MKIGSIEALELLKQIILDKDELNTSKEAHFKKAMTVLNDLEKAAQENNFGGYTAEKLSSLRWHTQAAFGFGETNGHSKEQHRVWALTSINSLRGPHCFGRLG